MVAAHVGEDSWAHPTHDTLASGVLGTWIQDNEHNTKYERQCIACITPSHERTTWVPCIAQHVQALTGAYAWLVRKQAQRVRPACVLMRHKVCMVIALTAKAEVAGQGSCYVGKQTPPRPPLHCKH